MAEKYLKVIQNGVASFVPDNKRNRDFWTKQNAKVSKSRVANQEIVTLMEARPEEVAFIQHSGAPGNIFQPVIQPTSDVSELKKLLAKQQEQIDKLLAQNESNAAPQPKVKPELPVGNSDEPEFLDFEAEEEKGKKPGRPPKIV